jgi:hypothetical protein
LLTVRSIDLPHPIDCTGDSLPQTDFRIEANVPHGFAVIRHLGFGGEPLPINITDLTVVFAQVFQDQIGGGLHVMDLLTRYIIYLTGFEVLNDVGQAVGAVFDIQ